VSCGIQNTNMLAIRRSLCDLRLAVQWHSDVPIRLRFIRGRTQPYQTWCWLPMARMAGTVCLGAILCPMNRDDQRAYCLAHMVPVWERWTDGNQAAHRLLECTSADPDSHEELLRRLLDATRELGVRGNDSSVRAARFAALVCCQAYIGVPDGRFAWACERAVTADGEARRTLTR
jgi:hypothetical protein